MKSKAEQNPESLFLEIKLIPAEAESHFETCRKGRKGLYKYCNPLLVFVKICPKPFEDIHRKYMLSAIMLNLNGWPMPISRIIGPLSGELQCIVKKNMPIMAAGE
jgi:hypothetical protein